MPLRLTKRITAVFSLVAAMFLFLGSDCEESLPVYTAPEAVYSLRLTSTVPDPMALRYQKGRIIDGLVTLPFDLHLRNIFDETITSRLPERLGTLEIWLNKNPHVTTSLPVLYTHEVDTDHFSRFEGVSLDPGDSSLFRILWKDFQNNRGIPYWEYAELDAITWEGDQEYHNFKPLAFTAQAVMLPAEGGPSVHSNSFTFSITFYFFISPDDDDSIGTSNYPPAIDKEHMSGFSFSRCKTCPYFVPSTVNRHITGNTRIAPPQRHGSGTLS